MIIIITITITITIIIIISAQDYPSKGINTGLVTRAAYLTRGSQPL